MPDGLVDIEKLRETFDISEKVKSARFTRAFAAAGRRMREWVGDAAYDDALSEPPDDATRKADLEYAEAHLVMHFAVLGINTVFRSSGVVEEERVDGQTTIKYLSPTQIGTLQQQFLEEAEAITRPYLTPQGEAMPVVGTE